MSTSHTASGDSAEFVRAMEPVARKILGEPTTDDKVKRELRFGTRGSLCVSLAKGTWFSHETNAGGGVLDFVQTQKNLDKDGAIKWLQDNNFITKRNDAKKANGAAKANGKLGKRVATYDYKDANGKLLFQVVRFEPKNFLQRRPNGSGGWCWKLDDAERVLYRLPELLAAPLTTIVYVAEGEKDVDALRQRLLVATCNPGGVGKWRQEYKTFFRARHVIVLSDNDPQAVDTEGKPRFHPDGRPVLPGQDHAADVTKNLRGIAASVRILMLPNLPPKGDVSDWFAAGGTAEELDRLAKEAPEQPPNAPDQHSQFPPLLPLADFMATFKTPDYIVDGIIQRGRLYALTSPTGHGKTAVVQYLGIYIGAGRNIGNIEVTQGTVIFLAGENPDDLCCRMYAACQFYGLDPTKLPLHVMAGNFPLTPEAAEQLKAEINAKGINPVAIIFDTAASFFPGDNDNDKVQKGAYARNLRVLTTCAGNPFVLTPSHPVKNPDRDNLLPVGGGAFLNELDGNLTLWGEPVGEIATMHWQGKFRGADFQPASFALKQVTIFGLLDQRGRPIVSIVATLQTADQAETAARQTQGDEDTVLELMRRHPGISERAIATNAGWMSGNGVPHGAKVHRLLKTLQKDKLVRIHRRKWCLTDAGKQETKAE